jgi:hypothetical protein
MSSVSKEENRSPRPGNRRARNDNNQNEPSSGQRLIPPKVSTAQYRTTGGGIVSMNQNQNNEFGSNPTWNIPSQYSILQAAHQQNQQQNRDEIGADYKDDPNIYTGHGNVYSPEDAVSPPTMATSEAPTNWHEPTPSKSGGSNYTNQRSHRSFTDLINSAGNAGDSHHASLLNTDITKEALATLANDSLTNLDLNTGDINALVQEELSGQLKDSLKLESSPLKAQPPHHHHKNENKEYQDSRCPQLTDSKAVTSLDRQSSQLHTPDVSMSSNMGQAHNSPSKKK